MALDAQTRPQQSQMHFMSPDQVPQFTNPWAQEQMNDAASLHHSLSKPPTIRTTDVSAPFMSRTAMASGHMRHLSSQPGNYPNPNGLMPTVSNVGLPAFTSAEMSMAGSTAPSLTAVAGATYMPSFSHFDNTPRTLIPSERRLSQPAMSSSLFLSADTVPKPRQASLTDISYRARPDLDFTSGGMDTRGLAFGQPRQRQDSTSYQSSHSASSSVSSTHSFPYYHGGSIDSSATDYSDGTGYPQERAGIVRSSRPGGYLNNGATVPNQMMTTFSSKITSSTQKKHKCKVCDKRFTRPSSLQTHTYSHTGEKPFACEHDGCGRRFSVVSNLRRHKKVHQGKKHGE
ncbi:hypothetical protein FPQ18DRAFT_58478 [Pyronema domesticum]|uniref:Similar to Zinc finger protein C25B8.19c acc. no. Q9UTA1 n=1 Tax=Pyronema omphalodes (strain CBS 100304) TaxID=1076935 RepID=U4LP31_PYROM|nr:hypothetical protein FPQ18DRAFT_58478 [Pyronema domesticum]CCX16344.1 Similar to Zinc finger protein C25B8.19c; acc. no. Q9UTA1 [Pyronema omphalodes CBS 100304]